MVGLLGERGGEPTVGTRIRHPSLRIGYPPCSAHRRGIGYNSTVDACTDLFRYR
jgi:hypothetical protein